MASSDVFISYSHRDERWLKKLLDMMAPIMRQQPDIIWWDGKIKPSQKWRDEINKAMDAAMVGVLLVSPNYLASDFINRNELPYLLERARKCGVQILWILLADCRYDRTPLDPIHAAHNISRPLSSLKTWQRDSVLCQITKKIEESIPPGYPRVRQTGAHGLQALEASQGRPPAPIAAVTRGTGQTETFRILKPSGNPLVENGGRVPVPTIVWEKVAVRPDHPRLWFNKDTRKDIAARVEHSEKRAEIIRDAEAGDPLACALLYQIAAKKHYARKAIKDLLAGRVQHRIACVFDWTYDAMTEEQRREAIPLVWATAEVDRVSGWPRCSPYTSYPEDPLPSETPPARWPRFYNWTFHDQDWARRYAQTLETLIALAGHRPQAAQGVRHYWEYSLKDAALFLDYLRDGSYWQGYYWSVGERIAEIYSMFALMKSACGIDYVDPRHHPFFANLGRWLLYGSDIHRREVMYNFGDGGVVSFDTEGVYPALAISAAVSENPYVEWLARQIKPAGGSWFQEIFYHRRGLPCIEPPRRALARAFPGTGTVVMRSGWRERSVWAAVRWCDWFDVHVHPDAGSFTLCCQGPLAPDAGHRCPGAFHAEGYYRRTVAHNTITVRYPAAERAHHRDNPPGLNDGCQRTRDRRTWSFAIGADAWVYNQRESGRAHLMAFETHDLYDYCAGDATRAYRSDLLTDFIRQVVFLRDGVLVLFDRVETPRASLEKRWLMHLVGEPAIDGKLLRTEVKGHIEDYDGSLTVSEGKERSIIRCHTLLPARRVIRKVGGAIPNIPIRTLCRVPRTTQRMGTGSRWEWTDPLILYYKDALTGKKLGAICIEGDTPTEAEYEVTDTEFYLKLNAYERGKTDDFRCKLADYQTLLGLACDLGKRLDSHTAMHYLPGYEYYNEGVNYAPTFPAAAWRRPGQLAPSLLGLPNEVGSWRIEVYPAKQRKRDCFLHVIEIHAGGLPQTSEVKLGSDSRDCAEVTIALKGIRYAISFAKNGKVGGHISINDAQGKVLANKAFCGEIAQAD